MSISFDYLEATTDAIAVSVQHDFQRDHPYQDGAKRMLDLGLILLFSPLWIPIVGLIAGTIALQGQWPIFLQDRVGRGGRVFTMIKFRTMVNDPERFLEVHLRSNPHAAQEWRVKQKLTNDPRVTPIGRILRRSSLDELPQLINVLMGDMSLVGPRPMLANQRVLYPGNAYYRMRPGITGPWQVSKRNQSEFAARSRFDAIYDLRQGLFVDLSLIARTFVVVWRQTGC